MLLNNISHTEENASGIDKNGVAWTIDKSTSYIYKLETTYSKVGTTSRYHAVNWKDQPSMHLLEHLLLGKDLLDIELAKVDNIHIRFGWIARDLYQLEFVPIRKVLDRFLNYKETATEKNKLMQICRVTGITMSTMTKVRKAYQESLPPTKRYSKVRVATNLDNRANLL